MEKDRGYKLIILLALLFSFLGLTLGFAAMSNEEKFSKAMQELDNEMNNFVSLISGTTKEINSLDATTYPGTINGKKWSGISINIESDKGYATVGANIKNIANSTTANLSQIYTTTPIKCYSTDTNEELSKECENINIVVTIGNSRLELNSFSTSSYVPKTGETIIKPGESIDAILTINFLKQQQESNESFRVEIPTIYYNFIAKTE